MSPITLIYFNLRARGEIVRLALKYGGLEFEDRRMEFMGEEWKAMKKGESFEDILS